MKNNSITGPVVEGKKIARQLGYPTVNLEIPDDFFGQYGIYAGFMEYMGKQYPGVISIGITPNFRVVKPKLEIHIFDFDQDMYGKTVKVTPIHYLREELKFKNIELLVKQIERDCIIAKKVLKRCTT